MRRRDFITLLGGSGALSLAARAQNPERVRQLGILFGGFSESDPEPRARVEAFRLHLQELGWTDRRNIHIELRVGAGDADRVRAYAAELVGMMPDVLAANSEPALRALILDTQTIPIVFANVFDPVTSGFVASLAQPGGNVTGFTNLEPAMTGKWLELLTEISPSVTRVSVIFDRGNRSNAEFYRTMEKLAPSFRVQCSSTPVANAADIEDAIISTARESGGSLIVMGSVAAANRESIVGLAAQHRLPAVYPYGYFVRIGGLISYGVDGVDLWRRAAPYVDRILRGAKPGDLPVQTPTKFELAINVKTAKALGLHVAPTLLARADEVIE